MSDRQNLPHSTRVKLPNFTEMHELELSASQHPNPDIGINVTLTAWGNGCSFQHCMTPAQARNMAAELVKAADWIEANQVAYA